MVVGGFNKARKVLKPYQRDFDEGEKGRNMKMRDFHGKWRDKNEVSFGRGWRGKNGVCNSTLAWKSVGFLNVK